MKRNNTWWGRLRDKTAHKVCNFMLNRVATPWYRAMIGGSIILGLETAAKERENDV